MIIFVGAEDSEVSDSPSERSDIYYEKILLSYICIHNIYDCLLNFTGCQNENEVETPNIYVSFRHSTTDDIPSLTWIVENRSKTSSVIFKEGDILNYEIKITNLGKIVTNDEKETKDIILEPDESYETTIEFRDMPIGHYEATFWADWNDVRKSSMTIQFDIEK